MNTDVISQFPAQYHYVLLPWPYTLEIVNLEWFTSECLVYDPMEDQPHMPFAFLVPLSRMIELREQGEPWMLLFENSTPKH